MANVPDFVTENYWYIAEGHFNLRTDLSFADQVSDMNKSQLALALAESSLFKGTHELTLYPLLPIRAHFKFEGKLFFILDAQDLSNSHLPDGALTGNFAASQFPPLVDWDGLKHTTPTWLGVRSPLAENSRKSRLQS